MGDLILVRVDSPEKSIFEGKAKSVSSTNSQGKFDILPFHAGFLTLIEEEPIIIRTAENKEVKLKFDRAVIYNRDNVVSVYTL